MLNPKYKRYSDRLRSLIEEGKQVVKLAKSTSYSTELTFHDEDRIQLQSWLTKVRNILQTAFGFQSPHFHHFEEVLPQHGVGDIIHPYGIYPIIGVLEGALDDLENGYLLGQEFLIAAEVFDSILEQAKQLYKSGYKDPAAVLARVILEDSLKRLARMEGFDENQKASAINDELKKRNRYSQIQWRTIQAWLDLGNAAAHGKFNDYQSEDVINLISNLEIFLVKEFHF